MSWVIEKEDNNGEGMIGAGFEAWWDDYHVRVSFDGCAHLRRYHNRGTDQEDSDYIHVCGLGELAAMTEQLRQIAHERGVDDAETYRDTGHVGPRVPTQEQRRYEAALTQARARWDEERTELVREIDRLRMLQRGPGGND